MDWAQYEKIPTEFATAREIGLAAATLGAMARRGLLEVVNSTPKKYRRVASASAKIYQLCEENKNAYDTYFILYKKDKSYGMLCSISNGTILDCWGKPYDLTDVIKVQFNKTKQFEI